MTYPSRPFPTSIDSTMRSAFVGCHHKYFMEYYHHWKPLLESPDLVAGKAFAAGLEHARKAYWMERLTAEESLTKGVRALIAAWGSYEEPSGHVKSLDRMVGALDYYFSTFGWQSDHIKPFMTSKGPAVEQSFALPIPDTKHPETGDPILYTGRFDMVGEYNGSLFAVDEKTTKQLGPQWTNQWRHRGQITGYTWAAQQFGQPVVGGIIRGVSILKSKYGHAESLQYRPDWVIDRWLRQLSLDVGKMVQCWESGYWDYDLDTACTNYGGCCFRDVCNSTDEIRTLEQYFEQRVWDPLAKDAEGNADG